MRAAPDDEISRVSGRWEVGTWEAAPGVWRKSVLGRAIPDENLDWERSVLWMFGTPAEHDVLGGA